MTFDELQANVFEGYRRGELDRCFRLLDTFLLAAEGEDRGKALSLKAAVIAETDESRTDEGLDLIEEALVHLARAPGRRLLAVVNALALCHTSDARHRADHFADLGFQLLSTHPDDPEIVTNRFRLYMNLGQHAKDHGAPVLAFWYYSRAIEDLMRTEAVDGRDPGCFLFWCYVHLASVCITLDRASEAWDSVDKAELYVTDDSLRERWVAIREEVRRATVSTVWAMESEGSEEEPAEPQPEPM